MMQHQKYGIVSTAIWAACTLGVLSSTPTAAADPFDRDVKPFLRTYCFGCHGEKQQKGDRRFDSLTQKISDDDELIDFQDILDQLNLGDMPPADARQPSDDARQRAVDWLTDAIAGYHRSRSESRGDQVTLRRMNAREYRNTIGDLLDLNMSMFDPTETFPSDQTVEHLDNIGSALVTSSQLLSRYLEAADAAVTKAIYPLQKPKQQTWVFRDGFRQQPEIDQVHRKTNNYEYMTLYDVPGADKPEGAYGPILAFAKGVPYDGVYEIKFRAQALNRLHPYDDAFLGRDRSEPLKLGIVPGNHNVSELHLFSAH